MGLLTNIFITAVTILATAFGAYNYVPLSWFEVSSVNTLGSSITTIAATDTLKDSRAVINTNFTNLNNGKIENSTTSVAAITTLSNLSSIGTITTGVWTGTTILPANGGTGSTTLSSNQVLLGNGTGNIAPVSGWGTTGQFLTSNGGVLAPTWTTSAVDQAINYTWTGQHTFASKVGVGSTTPYALFSVHASSTASQSLLFSVASSTASATSTLLSVTRAGMLGVGTTTRNDIRIPNIATTTNILTVDGDTQLAGNLVVNGTCLGCDSATSTTMIPMNEAKVASTTYAGFSGVTLYCGLVNIPNKITVNTVSIYVNSVGAAGTVNLAWYNVAGVQVPNASTTSASIASTGVKSWNPTTAFVLNQGQYWQCLNANGGVDITYLAWNVAPSTNYGLDQLSKTSAPAGKVLYSFQTNPSSTAINPLAGTGVTFFPIVRLDN